MSLIFWRRSEPPNTSERHEPAREVNEQHPLPTGLYWTHVEGTSYEEVGPAHPLPVRYVPADAPDVIPARAAFSIAAVSGDAVVLFGYQSRVIKLLEVGIAKPTVAQTVIVVKRSSNTSGGTSTTATVVPMDNNDPPPAATVRLYTAAGTAGTAVGNIARCAVGTSDVMVFDFRNEPPTLRSADECLAVNVDATGTLPGWIVWQEEPR